jgi:hypothetical protein
MPRLEWPLRKGRPCVEVVLTMAPAGIPYPRTLLADTGAGSSKRLFELILDEDDCVLCGGIPGSSVTLSGAYVGPFPLYDIAVQIPALGFAKNLRVVAVPSTPSGFDGIACFSFVNRFHYGNFGNAGIFGLES